MRYLSNNPNVSGTACTPLCRRVLKSMQYTMISVTYNEEANNVWAHRFHSTLERTSRIRSATSCGHFSMRILIKRSMSPFCSFLIVIDACAGVAVRAAAADAWPDCARVCLAISRDSVVITTDEREVVIKVSAVREVKHVSLFGVKMPLSTLKQKTNADERRCKTKGIRCR